LDSDTISKQPEKEALEIIYWIMAKNSGNSLENESIGMTIKLYSARGDSNDTLDVTTLESTVSYSISSYIKGVANEYLEI